MVNLNRFNPPNILKGYKSDLFECKQCRHINQVWLIKKNNKIKLKSFKCEKCGTINNIGDIFNFEAGNNISKKLDNKFKYNNYVRKDWEK